MIARLAVSTKGLVKRYGKRRALDGFTLDVPAGKTVKVEPETGLESQRQVPP